MDLDKAIEARSILVKELYPLSLRGLSEIGTEGLIKEAESKIERIQRSVEELQELDDWFERRRKQANERNEI